MKNILIIISFALASSAFGQSFNDEKTSMINYIKRVYNSSPFEGAKLIEGDVSQYYVAVINLSINNLSPEAAVTMAEKKAQDAGKTAFAEPCIKFEMLTSIVNNDKNIITYFFSFQPLSDFIKITYKKQPFDGSKIIAAPKNKYFVSVIALDPQKYSSESLIDRVALIKAKQQANALFNGSVISSDVIIQTESSSGNSVSIETIKEQSMGFVEGLETLSKFIFSDKKVYIFYRELNKH